MSVEDRLDILNTIARYAHAWDDRDPETYTSCFVEDGLFEAYVRSQEEPMMRHTPRTAILEWATRRHAEFKAERLQTRHMMLDTVFDELTADRARTHTLLLETNTRPDDIVPWVVGNGVYRDLWRKTPEGWRLAERRLHYDRWQQTRPRDLLPPVRHGVPMPEGVR